MAKLAGAVLLSLRGAERGGVGVEGSFRVLEGRRKGWDGGGGGPSVSLRHSVL